MPRVSCIECGATGETESCAELFSRLLALDHERRSPWAEHHAVNVACYLLQHPSQAKTPVLSGQWQVIERFTTGGLEAVHDWTTRRVARNNHRHHENTGSDHLPPAPDLLHAVAVTIEDVSADGTFPTDGATERIRAWADATAASRRTTTTSQD